jgi:PP-loop superfamily ATP-utilizing enzyme
MVLHAEDMKDCRAGMRAKKERSVISPLAETGFSKSDIRQTILRSYLLK